MSDAALSARLGVPETSVARARALVDAVRAMALPEVVRSGVLSSLGADGAAATTAVGGTGADALERGTLASPEPARWVRALAAIGSRDERSLPLQQLVSSAGEQLTATHTTLADASHPIRLGDVQLTLRGALANEADQLAMRFDEAVLVPGAVSEVVLQYRVAEQQTVAEGSTVVPDLAGYTRSLALRKLQDRGLGGTVAWQITDDPRAAGRVVQQRPPAGTTLERGQNVALHLGRVPQEVQG